MEGFNWREERREEQRWLRTYRLWSVQLKDPGSVSFDQFMGREQVMSGEAKFEQLWDAVERDRASGAKQIVE